jgi:hypothetical protein
MEGILSSLGHYAASKKSSRAEENLSTWIRLFFCNLCGFLGSLCSRAELGDVERQTNVQSSNSHRLSGEIANEDPSPYLAHSPTFLLFLRQGAIAFV